MTDRCIEGLPVEGDIVAKYAAVQLNGAGTKWIVKSQRMVFEYILNTVWALDLSIQTRIIRVTKTGAFSVVRTWQ